MNIVAGGWAHIEYLRGRQGKYRAVYFASTRSGKNFSGTLYGSTKADLYKRAEEVIVRRATDK